MRKKAGKTYQLTDFDAIRLGLALLAADQGGDVRE